MAETHQAVRRYTDMLESMIPDLEDLVPADALHEAETVPGSVTIRVSAATRRRLAPALAAVAAAVVVVIAIAMPLLLLALRAGEEPTAPTSTASPSTTFETSTTIATREAWPNAYVGIDLPVGVVNGQLWPPDSIVRVTLNGEREQFVRTDEAGTFVASGTYFIQPGDVVAVEVGELRKEILWREFTIDVFDRDTGRVEGAADLPDESLVSLTVYPTANDTPRYTYDVPVERGRWGIDLDIELGPESGAGANWFDEDGDVPGYYE